MDMYSGTQEYQHFTHQNNAVLLHLTHFLCVEVWKGGNA